MCNTETCHIKPAILIGLLDVSPVLGCTTHGCRTASSLMIRTVERAKKPKGPRIPKACGWTRQVLGGCQKSGAPHKMWKFYTSTTTIEINFE